MKLALQGYAAVKEAVPTPLPRKLRSGAGIGACEGDTRTTPRAALRSSPPGADFSCFLE
jgi:hypothetical protein